MTYKTRQEVLRAAADWMDVCEKAGINAVCKWKRDVKNIEFCAFDNAPEQYEFPLALLEGKEVWVGSELWTKSGYAIIAEDGVNFAYCSWNKPMPKTVTLTANYKDVEACANSGTLPVGLYNSCKLFIWREK